jgi:uridine kinase
MPDSADLSPALDRIAAAAHPDGVAVAGISGIDCAGKSTYASRLAQNLHQRLPPGSVVHSLTIDDFCRPREERYRDADQALGYYRDSFDFETLFGALIEPLKRNGRVDASVHTLDWERDLTQRRRFVIHPPAVVIVEGVFLFRERYRALFDVKVWLDVSFETALSRALERPREVAHYQGPDVIVSKYNQRFFPGQKLHLELDQPKAHSDLIVSTEAPAGETPLAAAQP